LLVRGQCKIRLSGRVEDDHTGLPLQGATLQLEGTKLATVSDEAGRYQFVDLCPGNYRLLVSHVSCDTISLLLVLKSNARKDILLHHTKVELQGVTVQGLRVNNTQVIEKVTDNKAAASKALNLGEVLRHVNGVTLLSTGSTISKPVIHGLHSHRILIMNNGVRLEGQQWGNEHAPEVDPYAAGKFSVLKGAAAVRYGADAIAGVVLVEPRPMPQETGLRGEVNAAVLSNNLMGVASLLLEQKLAKIPLSWRVQSTVKRGGNTRIPGYWLKNTGVSEFNYSGTLVWRKEKWGAELFGSAFNTQLGLFPGAHVETIDDLNAAIKSPSPLPSFQSDFTWQITRPRQEVQHYTGKMTAWYKWDSKTKLSAIVSHQENFRDEYDARAFIALPEMSLNVGTTAGEVLFEKTYAQKHLLQLGTLVQRQENVNGAISARQFIRNYKSLMAGAFGIWQFTVNRFDIEAGARYDYKFFESFYRPAGSTTVVQHTRTFSNVSGSLGILRRISPMLKLRANAATAWRPPAPNELYAYGVHQGLASFEIGNQEFKAERAFNLNLELTFTPDSSFGMSAVMYQNFINDFIFLVPTPPPILTIRGYYPVFEFRQTNATFTGTDLQWWYTKGRWRYDGKAALLWARDTKADDWLIYMPPNRMEHAIDYRFPSSANRTWQQIFAGINWIYTAEQKRVPDPKVAVDYAPPPPAYNLFGVDAGAVHSKSGMELGLTVTNLLNTRFRDYLNRLRYFSDAAGINLQLRAKIPLRF
jgi:iron complex outermembrane receptor protein